MYRSHLSSKKASIEWKIEKFFNRDDPNAHINSRKFLFSDADFYIRIYPNGDAAKYAGWVSLYLCKESSPSDVHVEYTLGLKKSVDGSVFRSYNSSRLFPSRGTGFGYPRFFIRSQLTADNILGANGTLIVFCNARVAENSTTETETQTSDTFETLSKDYENIFVSKCYTDVLIDVKGKKFSAHRSILSSRSSVFRSMFDLDMKEKHTGTVNIMDCDPESFESFLLFLYSGKLDVVTSNNALDLYVTAEKYSVQELKKACCELMVRDLCVDSVCDVVPLAALYGDQELLTSATDYFVENADKILKTSKWMTFIGENLSLANKLYIKLTGELTNRIINKEK